MVSEDHFFAGFIFDCVVVLLQNRKACVGRQGHVV